MILKFLAVTVQFSDMEADHVIASSFEDVGAYLKEYFSSDRITCIIIEPVNYFKKRAKDL